MESYAFPWLKYLPPNLQKLFFEQLAKNVLNVGLTIENPTPAHYIIATNTTITAWEVTALGSKDGPTDPTL